MHRTLIEARALIERKAKEHGGEMTGVDFVLCEDFKTVMVYVDMDGQPDIIAIYFDLGSEAFDRERHAAEFISPPKLN